MSLRLGVGLAALVPLGALAQLNVRPGELEGVDVAPRVGAMLPLDAPFKDHLGRPVRFGAEWSTQRPALLVFAYHSCPMLCSLVLDAAVKGLRAQPWKVGQDFDVVVVSIDPKDTPERAFAKRAEVLGAYGRADAQEAGWHFLVGEEPQIRRVADAAGFSYRYDAASGEYAHPAALFLLSPQGKLTRQLFGLEHSQSDLRLALLEAAEGLETTVSEKLLLFCYQYDPKSQGYVLFARRFMKVGGALTVVALGGVLAALWRRERRATA